jgi:hypothetical protein
VSGPKPHSLIGHFLTMPFSARRQFTPEDFWVMSNQMDLQGFVEAAV